MGAPASPALPALVVTVDTEGDNVWSRRRTAATANAACLPRFHELCRRYGLRPVYLVTFEMATCPEFQRFGRAVLADGDGEIGMHLHPWNSPPHRPLSDGDDWHQPFVTQFPPGVIREKITVLTRLLEDTFQVPVRSHRGGRWAFDEVSARVLLDLGYGVDSSVTPHVDWRRIAGGRVDPGAPDYSRFPERPYFLDPDAIHRPGASDLLEVPVTTFRIPLDVADPGRRASSPHVVRWLRPNGRNLRALRWVVERAVEEGRPCLVMALHSSELLPGGSPGLPRAEDVEALFRDLEALFSETTARVRGATLSEVRHEAVLRRAGEAVRGA